MHITNSIPTCSNMPGSPANARAAGFACAAALFLDCGRVSNSEEGNKRHRSARAAYRHGASLTEILPEHARRRLPRVLGEGHVERRQNEESLYLSIYGYANSNYQDNVEWYLSFHLKEAETEPSLF